MVTYDQLDTIADQIDDALETEEGNLEGDDNQKGPG
jgi:hypothetical protein